MAQFSKTESGGSEAVAALLLNLLPSFMLDLRQEMRRNRVSSLTMPQFRVLAHIWWAGPANNKCIAESLGVTVANSSRMINLLVQKKFLVRERGLKDKREVLVRLSPKGREHYQMGQLRLRAFVAGKFTSAPENQLAKMEEGLALLQALLGAKIAAPSLAQKPLSPVYPQAAL